MLVTIISAVHSLRMGFVEEYYTSRGYEVENITLDTSSVSSLFTQFKISKKIRKTIENMKPDVVYCEALFDLLIKELGVLKRKNNNMKLIFDQSIVIVFFTDLIDRYHYPIPICRGVKTDPLHHLVVLSHPIRNFNLEEIDIIHSSSTLTYIPTVSDQNFSAISLAT